MEPFGEWLRLQRTERKLTRDEFAKRVGCSIAMLRKIEDGERHPSAQIAELIANCLDIPLEQRLTFVRVARGELRMDRLSLRSTQVAASNRSSPKTNLPIIPTPLIGRERELEQLSGLLRVPECRLLTLVGPGGIGKTRLAIETATQLENDFPDGTFFVPLAPINGSRYLVPLIADSIGFNFQGASPMDPKTQLLNYLKEKQILMLIDNLEHLLNEQSVIELLAELIQQAPGIKLITTSRESLNLQHEWVFEVHGLPIPEGEVSEGNSVELFLQRARRANVGFTAAPNDYPAILRICTLVGGTPLGIELAAAWVRTLSCVEIAKEIERGLDFLSVAARDLPVRHRSIRAVFDHSWKLLFEDEKSVLSRLSVFRGGFSLEAAEQIAGATLFTLSSLVTKSLIRRTGNGRYDLHELMRQYTADRLHENLAEEDAAHNRHCLFYLATLQQCEAALTSERQEVTLAKLNAEIDNLRTAWEWAATHRQVRQLRQAVWSWWYYYSLRGLFHEGEAMLLRAVESARTMEVSNLVDVAENELALAHLQVFPTFLALRLGRVAEAQRQMRQSLETLRRYTDQAALLDALWAQGTACMFVGQFRESSQYLRESYSLACALNRSWETETSATLIGKVEFELGNYAEAQHWLREGLALSEAHGNPVNISFAISALSQTMFALGRAEEMEPILRKRLQLVKETGNQVAKGLLMEQLAQVTFAMGNLTEANNLCQETIALYRELGDLWNLSRVLSQMGYLKLAGGNESQAKTCFIEALALAYKGHLSANAVDALAGIATAQAQGKMKTSALEIIVHILRHPTTTREAKSRAESLRAELEADLTVEQIKSTQAQAERKSFEKIVEELLR